MTRDKAVEQAYSMAGERYGALGVDTDAALERLRALRILINCWQGDDIHGFEHRESELSAGLRVTGSYPGRARTGDELRSDLDKAFSLIPGAHDLNLHAIYAETDGPPPDRDRLAPEHFERWMDWAAASGRGLGFNPTFFSHPKAADGFTLSHRDAAVREFWIDHGIACRRIGEAFGRRLGRPCVTNFWIPDGYKDLPSDRRAPRERLVDSLDRIFAEKIDPAHNRDALESKLFGIGSESYVVGSHEFYMGYALSRGKMLCLDSGHFHPTESISDKISSILLFSPELFLHVSRGVRWDSDHVATLTDDLLAIAREVVRGEFTDRVHVGLDYFDAGINRVAAWIIGARAVLQAFLQAFLEPSRWSRSFEEAGDFTARLAAGEAVKTLPVGAVWDYYCLVGGVGVGLEWLDDVRRYERDVASRRD